ncbi:MAG TPA: hypothetical protein DDX07_07795 [Porphyromonadaceae bacterium]|nr:hypothetical protein [Porphyromonadaceae bacterium]
MGSGGALKKTQFVRVQEHFVSFCGSKNVLRCIRYSINHLIMNAMKDFDGKSRKMEKDPSQYITEEDNINDFDLETDLDEDPDIDLDEDPEWDPELDMDIDLEIDPDQSEASRYNEEEFLDSDEQVNENDSLNENRVFN